MLSGQPYYDNDLVVAQSDGSPMRAECVTKHFSKLLRRNEMPHIRFHDLRHSAATNMHEMTGDFFTVGEILGHTLKGTGLTLGMSSRLDVTTAQYVEVRIGRKQFVLDAYHRALHPEALMINRTTSDIKKHKDRDSR